jgi:hypothetical protein
MKAIIATLLAFAAATSFAAEPAKAEVKAVTPAPAASAPAPAKAEVKKDAAKPAKSTPAKDEKAAGPATKPATK